MLREVVSIGPFYRLVISDQATNNRIGFNVPDIIIRSSDKFALYCGRDDIWIKTSVKRGSLDVARKTEIMATIVQHCFKIG